MAKRAKVGLSTLKDFEGSKRAPMRNNLEAILHAIEAAGVHPAFREDGSPLGILADAQHESGSPATVR